MDEKERGNKPDLGLWYGLMALDYLIFPGNSLMFIYMQPYSVFSPVCCTPSCSKPPVVHPGALLGKLSTTELWLQGQMTG